LSHQFFHPEDRRHDSICPGALGIEWNLVLQGETTVRFEEEGANTGLTVRRRAKAMGHFATAYLGACRRAGRNRSSA
jgi:hypothetical protein